MFSFKNRYSPIGLHLGAGTVSLVQLSGADARREVHALAQAEIPPEGEAPPEERDRQAAAILKRLVGDHPFKGRRVVSCLGSQELFVQNVRLPQVPAEEVERAVSWEAEDRLPYPIAEAEVRYMLAGQVRQDASVKQEVILLASHRQVIERHVSLLEQAGLTPLAIDVEPCAVLRCLRQEGEGEPEQRRAFLNLGDRTTTVLFAEGERIVFLKYINSGGHHLDQAVARHLGLDLSEAARMRALVTGAAELDPEDEVHRSVVEAIRPPLEAMGSEIELCLRYYTVTFRGRPLQDVVVTGSESSEWLAEFLADRLGTPCRLGDPFACRVQRPAFAAAQERPWRWTTALGLALRPAG